MEKHADSKALASGDSFEDSLRQTPLFCLPHVFDQQNICTAFHCISKKQPGWKFSHVLRRTHRNRRLLLRVTPKLSAAHARFRVKGNLKNTGYR